MLIKYCFSGESYRRKITILTCLLISVVMYLLKAHVPSTILGIQEHLYEEFLLESTL